ncbi:MAG: GTPase HflX [Dehalococcoidia bacterium]|nr:GTPase HflX [Dehalococcoidia bacterium]
MPGKLHTTAPTGDRAYLVAADLPGAVIAAEDSLEELAELATSAGARVVGATIQRRRTPTAATYIGKGKLEEVGADRQELGANVVIFDDELSPSQQRNLEEELGIKVLDRTALILDIFATRASTREGKLQVELAQMQYLLPRLAGQWSHLERMEGAIGTRGPGETQIETDRRLVRSRIDRLRKDLKKVQTQRELYRRQRRRSQVPVVALVGYTNAGKSTIMRRLSGANVLAANKLFATLDPVTRRVNLEGGDVFLLSDTVGFIQKLPTQLVAAFRATLEELTEAHLLLHVVDVSHPHAADQAEVVARTLEAIGAGDRRRVLVLNKADRLLDQGIPGVEELAALARDIGDLDAAAEAAVAISATKEWGLAELKRVIEERLAPAATQAWSAGR